MCIKLCFTFSLHNKVCGQLGGLEGMETCRMLSLVVISQLSYILLSEIMNLLISVVSPICSLIAWNLS
jgi:hypothetical protein